jgi:uncharacterized membrane protein YdjX (TVP38/TMEM64 family)
VNPRDLWRPFLLLAGLAAAGLGLHEMAGHGWTLALRGVAGSPAGCLGFVLGGAIACAIGAPRQAVAWAAGWSFGLLPGFGVAMTAQVLGCALDFAWARGVARGWARRRMGRRLRRMDAFLAAHPFSATLMLRLLPVGNNLALSLLGGASALPAARFLAASALGYVPQTLVFVLLGTGTRVGRTTEIALSVVLLGISVLLGIWLLRRFRALGAGADAVSEDAANTLRAATPLG